MIGPTQELRFQLHEVAFRQAGYFTAAQALTIGYSYQAQKYHADHGNWVRVDRGLYRLPGWPSGPDDTYARWSLWSRGRGVISHESALALYDLSDANPARVHLTVPKGFRSADAAVRIHRATLEVDDVEHRGAWRITTVERTLCDVAGSDTSPEILEDAVVGAMERGMTTRRRLLRRSANASDHAALRLERALAVQGGDR